MALIDRYIGKYESAKSAADYIDASGIIKSANKLKSELEEFSNLSKDVKNAGSDLTPETFFVDNLDCSGMVETVSKVITESYSLMTGNVDEIIAAAEKLYNDKQEEYNQSARYRDQQEENRRAAMNSGSN